MAVMRLCFFYRLGAVLAFLQICYFRWATSHSRWDMQHSLRLGVDGAAADQPVVDIVSVGSHSRISYQDAQQRTFGSHPAVRNFFRITELDDTEKNCNAKVTLPMVQKVTNFCRARRKNLPEGFSSLKKMTMHYARFRWLKSKANPVGWLCAQRRPIDGLTVALRRYQEEKEKIPDYLLIADDDTWFNMKKLMQNLPVMYPIKTSHVVAGCMIRSRIREHNFTIPYGGWGTIINKPALQNLVRPIFCNEAASDEDEFTRLACWRVQQNQVGEKALFRNGMSVAQLMHKYVNDQPFQQVDQWNDVGYCMHSDWALGYFINFYHIPVHSNDEPALRDLQEERLVGYNLSSIYAGASTTRTRSMLRECSNSGDEQCSASDSTICHYVTENYMDKLHSNA